MNFFIQRQTKLANNNHKHSNAFSLQTKTPEVCSFVFIDYDVTRGILSAFQKGLETQQRTSAVNFIGTEKSGSFIKAS